MKKIKIAVVSPIKDATFNYRISFPLTAMASKGLVEWTVQFEGRGLDYIPCDIAIFQRSVIAKSYNLMMEYIKNGVKVVYDIDDDLPNLDPTNPANLLVGHDRNTIETHHAALLRTPGIAMAMPAYRPIMQMKTKDVVDVAIAQFNRHIEFVRRANLVTTSTKSIAQTLRGWGCRNPIVLQNRESEREWSGIQRTPVVGRVAIGWFGSISHIFTDIGPIIKPVTNAMLVCPNLDLYIGGVPEAGGMFKDVPKERVFVTAWLDWEKYKLEVSKLDVILAPSFGSHKFVRGKSAIRVTQGWMLGTPSIASSETYGELVSAVGGALIANNAREWEKHIVSLANDGDLRRSLGATGKDYITNQVIEKEYTERYQAYLELLELPLDNCGKVC